MTTATAVTTVNDVTVTITDDTISVRAPYSQQAVYIARNSGGKWNRTTKTWSWDASAQEYAQDFLGVYGLRWGDVNPLNLSLADQNDTVRVRVNIDHVDSDQLFEFGCLALGRANRDAPVRVGRCARLVGNTKPWGGSRRKPIIGDVDGYLIITNVPRRIAEAAAAAMPERYQVIEPSPEQKAIRFPSADEFRRVLDEIARDYDNADDERRAAIWAAVYEAYHRR